MSRKLLLFIIFTLTGYAYSESKKEWDFKKDLMDLIDIIKLEAKLTSASTGRTEFSEKTYEAMRATPRHLFVNESLRLNAYEDRPLPIGYGQTISQPYIVALMTDLLDLKKTDRVLEIGTGSGFQAAVLSHLAREVYSIEIVKELAESAKKPIEHLGLRNIIIKQGDGYFGWPEHAPFNAIIVTAAASHIPPALIKQLAPGGRLIIPIGPVFQVQYLTLVKKTKNDTIESKKILPVQFVPFTGEAK
jgi:protein-L-isoaspartate(D-aspartate) O-methyltransferase